MVISCGVVGCAKNRSNAPKEGFFRLPSLVNRVKPLNSEHLRVLKICPLLGGSLTKTVTFGTKHFCPLFKVCPLFGMSAIGRFHFTNETSQKFRKEFNIACLWKLFYFRQTSNSVRTIQARLASKFKSWIQKIISYFFTRVSLWSKCKEEKMKWK